MIEVTYPGKLFILGEYSIMEKNHSAIIVSVNRYIKGIIEAHPTLIIESDYGKFTDTTYDEKMDYVKTAYEVSVDYLSLKDLAIKPFKLTLTSELNNAQNQKYGFGSSGVVIVSVIDAVLKFHNVKLDKETLFKLSVVAQLRMNKLSSGGDLASSIYEGMIFYTKYDLEDVSEDVICVEKTWKYLKIKQIENPYHIEVFFTGKSHDTNLALKKFKALKSQNINDYNKLVEEANALVLKARKEGLLKVIPLYRDWMLKLGKAMDYTIETENLTKLIEISNHYGYAAKISGSGGGDCGFTIMDDKTHKKDLIQKLKENGLEHIEGAIQ